MKNFEDILADHKDQVIRDYWCYHNIDVFFFSTDKSVTRGGKLYAYALEQIPFDGIWRASYLDKAEPYLDKKPIAFRIVTNSNKGKFNFVTEINEEVSRAKRAA